ncbi:similar to Delta-interacting protein A (Hepatitis delta antigen interacting protein A) (predicted) [Rattus norvegicus]|uniref:Similar to Delta-interacting protein A (Hepatitis delta antigen interacting protein A) (Predicted) n=1 Tax=Rattus norvegicus TaxID=10116 RepID=A6HZ59_RAT|nr:similar to Delta-interacting protein A (Hepatitis delta antigen interacting protein A) (predicted) [Rattus norvegicus]
MPAPWCSAEAATRSGGPRHSPRSESNPGRHWRGKCGALSHQESRLGATDPGCPHCQCWNFHRLGRGARTVAGRARVWAQHLSPLRRRGHHGGPTLRPVLGKAP